MLLLKPDPTFYPSAKLAMQAPAEGLAYVATVQRNGKPDALRVVDLDANSPTYGQFVHTLELPYVWDELYHLGWNACSALQRRGDGAGVMPESGRTFVTVLYL